ncbi:hypothetical protein PVAND_009460 [Polypedilum vanderplanki]|uniref:Uncharacterized protein n=1 Tax=Polypedilum vanderplanki TaxID=319348 RepID=A0A9J6CCT7_POLVA|nr:hypothetical protein PVAND_009460 [Polypedilum vanderplanki]
MLKFEFLSIDSQIEETRSFSSNVSLDEEEYLKNEPQNSNAEIPRSSSIDCEPQTQKQNQQNEEICEVMNEKPINEQAKLDEQAQNLTWTSIKPILQRCDRQTLPSNSSIFQVRQSFNSIEKANQTAHLLRSQLKREYEKYNENFSKAIKIMLEKVTKTNYDFDDKIIQEEQQIIQKEIIIPENQLNIMATEETLENHHQEEQQQQQRDNIEIKSIPLVNNTEFLEKIFTQHEKSTEKGQNLISNRSNDINHGKFVLSQFSRYENSSDESDLKEIEECECEDSLSKSMSKKENHKSRKLIEENQIINDWLMEPLESEIRKDSEKDNSSFKGDQLLTRSKIKQRNESNLNASFYN